MREKFGSAEIWEETLC